MYTKIRYRTSNKYNQPIIILHISCNVLFVIFSQTVISMSYTVFLSGQKSKKSSTIIIAKYVETCTASQ